MSDYSDYTNPHFYNETPMYVVDSTGYLYQSYYPQAYAAPITFAGAAPGIQAVNRYDDMTGIYYTSY